MTIHILHTFASLKSDGVDTTLVQPSNWNDEHIITLAAGKVLGRHAASAGAMQELPLSVDASDNWTVSGNYMVMPGGTTADRPLVPAIRELRFNSDLLQMEFYDGVNWVIPGQSEAVPIGGTIGFGGRSEPANGKWKFPNGQALLRATYPDAFAAWVFIHVVTMTIASPCVVAWTAHGLSEDDPVKFTTSGALATPLVASTTYYAKITDADHFNLALTPGGTAIITTGSQSGTHTAISAPWGDGDGSTTFNVPDLRGRDEIGHDRMGTSAAGRMTRSTTQGIYGKSLGASGGEEAHQLTVAELAAHTHTMPDGWPGVNTAGSWQNQGGSYGGTYGATNSSGGDVAHNNVQPGLVMNKLIRVL